MRKNEFLREHVCRPYCAYYKPGKNEELLCRGAEVALSMAGESECLSERPATVQPESPAVMPEVVRELCGCCGFREHDCDFAQEPTAQPCGGFRYIVALLASGAVTIERIRRCR